MNREIPEHKLSGESFHRYDHPTQNFTVYFRCDAFLQDELVSLFKGGIDRNFPQLVSELVGGYLIIIDMPESVHIYRSLYKLGEAYYSLSNVNDRQELLISDNISDVSSPFQKSNINKDYCARFIIGDETHYNDTLLEGVYTIPLGYQAAWKKGAFKVNLMPICFPDTSKAPCAAVESFFSRKFWFDRQVTLLFSGGLDSTLLLASMKQSSVSFKALHVLPRKGEGQSEVFQAIETAKEFEVHAEVKDLGEDLLDETLEFFTPHASIRALSPYGVNFFENPSLSEELPGKFSRAQELRYFVSGRGGDEIYLQNPPNFAPVDDLIEGRMKSAISSIVNISKLKGVGIPKTISACIRCILLRDSTKSTLVYLNCYKKDREKHFLLRKFKRKPAKTTHIKGVLKALQSRSDSWEIGLQNVEPFLLQDSVHRIIDARVSGMFSDRFDRIISRNDLYQYSLSNQAWRRSKRSSSGLFHRRILRCQSNLEHTLTKGTLSEIGVINSEKVKDSIQHYCSFGFSDHLPTIVKMYQLESYICKISRNDTRQSAALTFAASDSFV